MLDSFDRRVRYLRVSVTDLCNMRCEYCMPAGGVELLPRERILSLEEIAGLVREAVGLGFDKVRLTGGEPLVRRGIIDLVEMIGKIPGIADYAMTSNGSLLSGFARDLRRAGIRRMNISLDSVDAARYGEITRGGDLSAVLSGISAAKAAGFEKIKLNCVVDGAPESSADALGVAEFARAEGLELRFIRRMRTEDGQFWRVIGGDGGECRICDRLRASCDGRIFPCLFNDINFSVRELGAAEAIRRAVAAKPERGQCSGNKFNQIGG